MEAARTHIGEIQSGCPQPAEVHKVAAVVSQFNKESVATGMEPKVI